MSHNVMAILKAKSGKESAVKEGLIKVAQLTRQEEGCMEFNLFQDPENPSQFGLNERWTSEAQYQQQFQKPYVIEFLGQVETLLEKPYHGFAGSELKRL